MIFSAADLPRVSLCDDNPSSIKPSTHQRRTSPMHLTPHDIDKLLLHNPGFLPQKRLARGTRLNYPETVALIATQILEFIRDGRPVAELMDLGRRLLGRNQVMP